ncbi:MAG TPA: hypothetical protein VHU91_07750 [Mycobacteriales bacterium]|nr:hypothetical protein [Mycobacteriales bacterium]
MVHARTGVVQSPSGGALGAQLPLFRLGLGGTLSRGNQWLSWIGLDDTVGLLHHAVTRAEVVGALNVVSPNPVTNREYTRALAGCSAVPPCSPRRGGALRWCWDPSGRRNVVGQPTGLARRGTSGRLPVRHPTLEPALRNMLGRTLAPFG